MAKKEEPLTYTYNVNPEDSRVIFPLIDKSMGDKFVLIPKTKFELVAQTSTTIILKEINFDPF